MEKSIKIDIAGTVYGIHCDNQRPISWLEENYGPFVSSKKAGLDVFLRLSKRRRSTSPAGHPLAWTNRYFHARTPFADIGIDFEEKKASVRTVSSPPMVDIMRFLCSIMLMKKRGFLLHASAVLDGRSSYIFFGPSESGKTTIARLSRGKTILTDETAAIARHNRSYKAYATPFFGDYGNVEKNANGPLKAVFFIKKSDRFEHKYLKPGEAVKQLFCNAIRVADDPGISKEMFLSFEDITKKVPFYELHFKKTPEIWRYIHGSVK